MDVQGKYGDPGATSANAISAGNNNCLGSGSTIGIICVEQ